jgi:hypothetical protein
MSTADKVALLAALQGQLRWVVHFACELPDVQYSLVGSTDCASCVQAYAWAAAAGVFWHTLDT